MRGAIVWRKRQYYRAEGTGKAAGGEESTNSKHNGGKVEGVSKHGSRHRDKQRGLLRSDSFGLGSVHRKASAATESFMMTTKEFLAMVRVCNVSIAIFSF